MNAGQYVGLLQGACFAAVLFALLTASTCVIAWPWLRAPLARLAPEPRANALLLLAVLPAGAAAFFAALSFAPSLLSLAGLLIDHCHEHVSHPHLCLAHPPALGDSPLLSLLVAALLAACAIAAASAGRRWWRARRLVHTLLAVSRIDARGVRVVASSAPMAFAAGLRHPVLFVSTHLLERLSAQQLAIVLAHEQAHARRRDTLRQSVAAVAAILHLPGVRRALLADLALAAEQACDSASASAADGDRLAVADTIIAVERLFARAPGLAAAPACHFMDSDVACRVQALLDGPGKALPKRRCVQALIPACLAALCLAGPVHHATEALLGILLRLAA